MFPSCNCQAVGVRRCGNETHVGVTSLQVEPREGIDRDPRNKLRWLEELRGQLVHVNPSNGAERGLVIQSIPGQNCLLRRSTLKKTGRAADIVASICRRIAGSVNVKFYRKVEGLIGWI